jgi:hypothetical protein
MSQNLNSRVSTFDTAGTWSREPIPEWSICPTLEFLGSWDHMISFNTAPDTSRCLTIIRVSNLIANATLKNDQRYAFLGSLLTRSQIGYDTLRSLLLFDEPEKLPCHETSPYAASPPDPRS